ncbi:hypothetical protein D5S18_03945 [Nocardia panacis]|uniref:Uncharacterized protein n=1 Tax=Nocardia panacis TaxID=2340916 RepID=A0A3A4KRG3_9NOCA|nr:hypothetical protein D5S18_03945 [Nocardia panacis]
MSTGSRRREPRLPPARLLSAARDTGIGSAGAIDRIARSRQYRPHRVDITHHILLVDILHHALRILLRLVRAMLRALEISLERQVVYQHIAETARILRRRNRVLHLTQVVAMQRHGPCDDMLSDRKLLDVAAELACGFDERLSGPALHHLLHVLSDTVGELVGVLLCLEGKISPCLRGIVDRCGSYRVGSVVESIPYSLM